MRPPRLGLPLELWWLPHLSASAVRAGPAGATRLCEHAVPGRPTSSYHLSRRSQDSRGTPQIARPPRRRRLGGVRRRDVPPRLGRRGVKRAETCSRGSERRGVINKPKGRRPSRPAVVAAQITAGRRGRTAAVDDDDLLSRRAPSRVVIVAQPPAALRRRDCTPTTRGASRISRKDVGLPIAAQPGSADSKAASRRPGRAAGSWRRAPNLEVVVEDAGRNGRSPLTLRLSDPQPLLTPTPCAPRPSSCPRRDSPRRGQHGCVGSRGAETETSSLEAAQKGVRPSVMAGRSLSTSTSTRAARLVVAQRKTRLRAARRR